MEAIIDKKSIESAEEPFQCFTFFVGSEIFGLSVSHVREVIEYEKVFTIPRTPDTIKGVINLRGEVVPVIDLCVRLYSKKSSVGRLTCIVISEVVHEGEKIKLGLLVDSIRAVTDFSSDNIGDAPEFGAKIRGEFISGIGKDAGKFVIILNADTLLNVAELSNFSSLPGGRA